MKNEKSPGFWRRKQKPPRHKSQEEPFPYEEEIPFSDADAEDPFRARLPALVLAMRHAHEEVVSTRDWIFWGIMSYLPAIGTILLFIAGYGKSGVLSKNIRNYARCVCWLNLSFSVSLIAASLLCVFHGREIWHFLMSLKGV